MGWDFVLLVVEAMGTWGGRARNFLQSLIRRSSLKHNLTMAQTLRDCLSRLQLVVVRELARQLELGFRDAAGWDDGTAPTDLYTL